MTVTAAMVKELRQRTAAGMMDCKKALTEAEGDMELAIENMRKNGQAKAAKKAGNIAAEGAIIVKVSGNTAALVEVNCQTDFVAMDENFLGFANAVADAALESKASIADLQTQFEEKRVALVTKIGENINVRRVEYVEGVNLASYSHGAKIGVVVAGEGDAESLKHIAMHVAASKPDYINPEDVPSDVVDNEKRIQLDILKIENDKLEDNKKKPVDLLEKIIIGKMKKFTGEISLTGQAFIMEPKKSVSVVLKEKGLIVSSFVRLEVGEGIEKKSEDFAAEVEAQLAAAKA
ncbi:MAG: elongation factor Ts [Gammaproteobacteria bacterium]|nr:MAG: elongation factor Ts [Gammaproteobacteria bacterium]